MLKTPKLIPTARNPILSMIAEMSNQSPKDTLLEEGFAQISHFSGDCMVWGSNAPEHFMGYPDINDICDGIGCYGVCDSPQQFIDKYKAGLEGDPARTFFCTFTHIAKEPSNAGKGGGWRWHKWGEYIGTGKHECEYLDDEAGFGDGVYVYHVLQIEGPEIRSKLMQEAYDRMKAHDAAQGK
jgi:hypothetical protein